jgi:hypothetical protein
MLTEKMLKEADECRREAERASDQADKDYWLRMAAAFAALAKSVEKR